MKYAAVFLFICAAFAAPVEEEKIGENEVQSAQFMPMMPPMGGMYNPMMDPMFGMNMGYPGMGMNMGYPGYPGMGMDMGYPGYPGMGGGMPMYYGSNREDYPVDYNQGCSNSCGCRQTCQAIFWMPCPCRCPPPCLPPPCVCNPCNSSPCPCPCQQQPEIPEFPPRDEDEKEIEDPINYPLLDAMRDRLVNAGILPERDPNYPADIVIRWRD